MFGQPSSYPNNNARKANIWTISDQHPTRTNVSSRTVPKEEDNVAEMLRWVPGHENIKGNERADQEAKKAAKGNLSTITDLPISLRGTLPISQAAELQRHHKQLKREAQELFAKSPCVKFALEIDPSLPSTEFTKMCLGLGRRHASLLIQL